MKTEAYRMPFDSDQCFFIQDFVPGDSILLWRKGTRKKGVVQKIDSGNMEVIYRTENSQNNRVKLDDIIFLKPFDRDWLK